MQSAGFRDVTAIAVLGKSWGGRVDERGARSKGQRKIKTQASTGVTGRPTNPLAPPTHMRALFGLVISAPPRGRHGDWTRHDEVLEAQESRVSCLRLPQPSRTHTRTHMHITHHLPFSVVSVAWNCKHRFQSSHFFFSRSPLLNSLSCEIILPLLLDNLALVAEIRM